MAMSGRDTNRIQIGQGGDDEQRQSVDETDNSEPKETHSLLPSNLSLRLVHVLPNLHFQKVRP
jgi:hypothetical protein